MQDKPIYLPDYVPNFPLKYQNEIPRDSLIRSISEAYGNACQKQLIISEGGTGKTNFLGQFCRHFSTADLPPVCTNPNIASGLVFGGQVITPSRIWCPWCL